MKAGCKGSWTHQGSREHIRVTWFRSRECWVSGPGAAGGRSWSCCRSIRLSRVSWEVCRARRSFSSTRSLFKAVSFAFILTRLLVGSLFCCFSRHLHKADHTQSFESVGTFWMRCSRWRQVQELGDYKMNKYLLRFWNQTFICFGSMLASTGASQMSCCRRMELGLGHSWYNRSSASICSSVKRSYFPDTSIPSPLLPCNSFTISVLRSRLSPTLTHPSSSRYHLPRKEKVSNDPRLPTQRKPKWFVSLTFLHCDAEAISAAERERERERERESVCVCVCVCVSVSASQEEWEPVLDERKPARGNCSKRSTDWYLPTNVQ